MSIDDEMLDDGEMLDEYDFSQGIRGKYFKSYQRNKQAILPGIQFLIDSQGRKTSVIVELKEDRALWENCVEKFSDLSNLQFFVNAQGEPIAVLLNFKQHLEIWQDIYDAIISKMPGYKSDLTLNGSANLPRFESEEEKH